MQPPAYKTRFVGRDEDLAALARAIGRGARIVTLWGPPGVGKTRLAVELCRRLMAEGAIGGGGICFCGVDEVPQVAEHRPAIAVLDDFDPLVHEAADTVSAWAERAPQTCFVITSRERLRIAGELTHEVPPLGEAAVELFLDRAHAAAGARVDGVDPRAVAELVRRLDGIPLAIELAAARVDVLGVGGLLSRLDRPLDLLAQSPRDAPPKHASMRQAIEWSFRLLSPIEQQALAQCSVFRGSFSLEGAERVLVLSPAATALDVLQALRDRSMVRCVGEGAEVRFSLYEPIREYAEATLIERGDADEARARHAAHYLAVAQQLGPADGDNLGRALSSALDGNPQSSRPGDIETALACIDPSVASPVLIDLLGRALDHGARAGSPPSLLARGHRLRGQALQLRGSVTEARVAFEHALAIVADNETLRAELWTDLGVLHHQHRDMERARTCYDAALAIHDGRGDRASAARCLGNLGALHHDLRRYDEALHHYQQALASFRAAGDSRSEGIFLGNLAILLQERGAFGRARSTYQLALERLALAGDVRLEAIARSNSGLLCHEMGELDEARARHERSLHALGRVVDPRSEALCLGRLAMSLAALGHHDDAASACQRAERMISTLGERVGQALLRLFRAFVDVAGGGPEEVARERLDEARAQDFAPEQEGREPAALVDLSDDARTAVRLVEALLAKSGAAGGVLLVGPEASWFTPPGGVAHDLARRRVLRRLLLRLIEKHREAPGEGLTLDALREAGWPGERVLEQAATNRVHVALTELRRRGLKHCLLRKHARYLIDPGLRVQLSDC